MRKPVFQHKPAVQLQMIAGGGGGGGGLEISVLGRREIVLYTAKTKAPIRSGVPLLCFRVCKNQFYHAALM